MNVSDTAFSKESGKVRRNYMDPFPEDTISNFGSAVEFLFRPSGPVHERSMMAFCTVCFVLHIKGSFAIMAGAAKFALRDFAHVHLIRTFLHLKDMIVTGAALFTLLVHVCFMAEVNGFGVFGIERQITTAYYGKRRTQRKHKIDDRQNHK